MSVHDDLKFSSCMDAVKSCAEALNTVALRKLTLDELLQLRDAIDSSGNIAAFCLEKDLPPEKLMRMLASEAVLCEYFRRRDLKHLMDS